MIFRLLVLTIVLFTSGIVVGWWLHYRFSAPAVVPYEYPRLTKTPSFFPDSGSTVQPDLSADLILFSKALVEERSEDALTLYQHHEHNNSPLHPELHRALLNQVKQWQTLSDYEAIITILERFTQYYYQDTELLKALALTYEHSGLLERAIEVLISARDYADSRELTDYLNEKIRSHARSLYESHLKQQTLPSFITLLQKLSWLEPEHAFYRFALANSYMADNDTDSAIRELEVLQIDMVFGEQASRLLAELRPPPPPEEPDASVGTVALSGMDGHFFASVVVGGQFNARLLIDTGATLTTLPRHLINRLRKEGKAMRIAHIEMKTANGVRMTPLFRLKGFQLGNYTLENLEVAELELSDHRAEGLLGMNVLGQFHFYIDQNRNTLSLTPR